MQHPERSFKEVETSAYLAAAARHGMRRARHDVGDRRRRAHRGRGAGTAHRAACRHRRPAHPEDTGLPFSSVNPGVMHGCGHDLHMTGLLGAAFWLADHRDRIAGSVKIAFPAGRGGGPGRPHGRGIRRATDDVKAIIGTHNNPNYAPGQIAIGPEPMMAGCVKFKVTLHAQGTHAGYPHKGTGPIEALASMILALQTIVSRNISPFHAVVLSITEVHGGHVWNVVPAKAGFQGTVRYFHKSDGELVGQRFKEEVDHIAAGYGITADVDWDDFQDPLVSD